MGGAARSRGYCVKVFSRILIRVPNWVGDAVMSLPALLVIRERFPHAHIAVLARPAVTDLYSREIAVNEVLTYPQAGGLHDLSRKARLVRELRRRQFDCAILFQNAFEAALVARLAGISRRIGYNRDGRGWLLTDAISVPRPGEIPRHERFYYLELLRRCGMLAELPTDQPIRLSSVQRHPGTIGVSPGAAYGGAKRWLPERFAEAAAILARTRREPVALFGSGSERSLCETVATALREQGCEVHNFAGETTLGEFIERAAACSVFLTNDSGAMHIASALGVPTIAVFGATDDIATGPTGRLARVVREPVECSPCLLRECPIDHRCMTRVSAERVATVALETWTQEARS